MSGIVRRALRRGEEFLERLRELPVSGEPDAASLRRHLREHYPFRVPVDHDRLLADVTGLLETGGLHVVHPRYFGYFNPTPLPEAVAGDLLAAIYNPQLAVWSHNPAAVEMEQHVLRWLAGKLGMPEGTGAHFTSGGSEANFTAVLAALTSRFPVYGRRGLARLEARPTIYHSAAAHDSFTKICHMTGLGRDALRVVPVDDELRLDLEKLAAQLAADRAESLEPTMVVATAGTTAAGIIDPLDAVADLCAEQELWFHVDAAWGGAAVLSPTLKPYLRGIERADSVTCDAHKWFNVTMGAGMFFCRDAAVLGETFRVSTDYMPDFTEGEVDPYVSSVQWSRRFIGLKLFLALASRGEAGYREMIEGQATMGDYLQERLETAGWEHVARTPLPVSCVTHPRIETGEIDVDDVVATVLDRGRAWVSRVALAGRPAIRACVTSYLTTRDDIDLLADELNAALNE